MKQSMSNLDIQITIKELRSLLVNGILENIYQTEKNIFLFKIYNAGNRYDIIFEPGIRFHLTNFKYPFPKTPPHFTTMLRRFIRRSRVREITQHDFDRIVIMDLDTKKGSIKVIFELFSFGNIILVDAKNQIRLALKYKKMRDRIIRINESFLFPPIRKSDFFSVNFDYLVKTKAEYEEKTIAKFISDSLNIGKELVEEICIRANLNPKDLVKTLNEGKIREIYQIVEQFKTRINSEKISPRVYFTTDNLPISATPFEFLSYQNYKFETFSSFNDALDHYFSSVSKEKIEHEKVSDTIGDKMRKLEKRIEEQKKYLQKLVESNDLNKLKGELVYKYLRILEIIRKETYQAIKEKKKPSQIKLMLETVVKEAPIEIVKIDPKKHSILVHIENTPLEIDWLKKMSDIGSHFFERYKKNLRKIKGIKETLNSTVKELKQLQEEELRIREAASKSVIRKKEKRWYHKFRWFISSDNFLVVGGKDAKTNDILIKKYLEDNDIFIHAEIHGAPAVIIKTDNKTPSQQTIFEACQFAVSFSNAWKAGLGSADAYWVYANQVSKTPPSGQYLAKGAFIITGKRNYLKNLEIKVAIGISIEEEKYEIHCGPIDAIEKHCDTYIIVKPNGVPKGRLSKTIFETFKKIYSEIDITIEEIQAVLPPGSGQISKIVKKS